MYVYFYHAPPSFELPPTTEIIIKTRPPHHPSLALLQFLGFWCVFYTAPDKGGAPVGQFNQSFGSKKCGLFFKKNFKIATVLLDDAESLQTDG